MIALSQGKVAPAWRVKRWLSVAWFTDFGRWYQGGYVRLGVIRPALLPALKLPHRPHPHRPTSPPTQLIILSPAHSTHFDTTTQHPHQHPRCVPSSRTSTRSRSARPRRSAFARSTTTAFPYVCRLPLHLPRHAQQLTTRRLSARRSRSRTLRPSTRRST